MTIKDLKTIYKVEKFNDTNDLLIYDKRKNSGTYQVYKFLCKLKKVETGVYQVEGFQPTSNLKVITGLIA